MKSQIQEQNENVVIAARVPPSVKEKVDKFAVSTQRTSSQYIHYLIVTHPEYVELSKEKTLAVIS